MDRGGVKSSMAKRGATSASAPRKAGGAGAIDADTFISSFEQVPRITLYASKDLTEIMTKIKDVLSNTNEDWEKRVEHLRLVRSVVIAGGPEDDDFFQLLRYLEIPVQSAISDLRSAVVRESCITVAYLSQELRNRFERFAEVVIPNLINLLANSAKIMATSGNTALVFIIKNTHSARMIPLVVAGLSSKTSVTRRLVAEALDGMCRDWPTHVLEKHLPLLQEALRKGISDADQETRAVSRRLFAHFSNHFKSQARALLQSLDDSKRKLIEKEMGGGLGAPDRNGGDSGRSQSTDRSAARRPASRNAATKKSSSTSAAPGSSTDGRTRTFSSHSGAGNGNSTANQERGRTPTKRYGVSMSTPNSDKSNATSREVSPQSRGGYVAHITGGYTAYAGATTPGAERRAIGRSRIPRSQGASREGSPSRQASDRAYTSIQRRSSGRSSMRANRTGNYAQRVLNSDKESEIALADALSRPQPRRFDQFDSDDNASETSSVCSETSYRSAGPFRGSDSLDRRSWRLKKMNKNIQDILTQLKSTQWGDRKDGLLNFQNYLRSGQTLNNYELKKVTEIFNKMFHDPHSKVMALFMESMQLFIQVYHEHLSDWLYIILVRLLTKQGNEMLSSQQKRIRETLDVVRSTFPLELQFQYSCKFIIDSTLTPSVKVKACLLEYMKDLMYYVSPDVLNNPNNDMRMAVSRVISWTTEPKSAEVRKLASRLVTGLFDLNTSGFTNILQSMPRSFQEAASKVLHSTLDASNMEGSGRTPGRSASSGRTGLPGDLGAESISPEDINTFIRQTTEDIQSLSYNYERMEASGGGPGYGAGPSRSNAGQFRGAGGDKSRPGAGERDAHSTDSGIQNSNPDLRGDVMDAGKGGDFMPLGGRRYNPTCYDGQVNPRFGAPVNDYHDLDENHCPAFFYFGGRQSKPVIGYQTLKKIRETPPEDVMSEILQELSNHNDRHDQRRRSMIHLIKLLREAGVPDEGWEEHFKPTLLILLETLGDNEAETRRFALKVLQELLRAQPHRFSEYVELTILRVLEAHRDPEKPVARAAEDCAQVLAATLNPEQCLRVLIPIVMNSEESICLAAVKIESLVVKESELALIQRMAADLIPGLMKGCDHRESSIRKACVFCLVRIHMKIGDLIWIHLKDLGNSKIRLLNLYIQRAKENSDVIT